MADINSNKNAPIIQPITLQIRAPFQLLTNHRAIKHTHYSESWDGLNGRCSFSAVCAASEYILGLFIYHKGCKVQQISPLFHLYIYFFFKFRRAPFCSMPTWHAKYCTDIYLQRVYGSRLMAKRRSRPFRFRRCF